MAERYYPQIESSRIAPPSGSLSVSSVPSTEDSKDDVVESQESVVIPKISPTVRVDAPNTPPVSSAERMNLWSKTVQGLTDFGTGILHGSEEGEKQSGALVAGATLTDFVRHGVDAGFELFSPERKEVRRKIEEIRGYDSQLADEIESSIGEQKSTKKNVIRLGASIGELALTVLPFFSGAKAAVATGEASKAIEAANATQKVLKSSDIVTRTLTKIPGMSDEFAFHVATGFKYTASFAGLDKLTEDADFVDAFESAVIGGTIGVAFPVFGKAGSKTLRAIVKPFRGTTANTVKQVVFRSEKFLEKNPKSMVLLRNGQSVGGTLRTYFPEENAIFRPKYERAHALKEIQEGILMERMTEYGLIEPPVGARKAYKDVPFIGKDTEAMSEIVSAIEGHGMYRNKTVQEAFINKNPVASFLRDTQNKLFDMAEEAGIISPGQRLNNFFPHTNTPIELKSKFRVLLNQAKTQAEREAIYASANPEVKAMVEYAVNKRGSFKTLEEGYETFYDWSKYVLHGGGHTPLGNNKFLNYLVTSGQASNVKEAEGKVIRMMAKNDRKAGIFQGTNKASSIEFERELDFPFYDVNPGRVLAKYASEVLSQVNNTKVFGKYDQVIHQLIGEVKSKKGKDQAESFSRLIDRVFHDAEPDKVAEEISAWIRGAEVFKIGFSPIQQVAQNLNTVLSSDFKTTASGIAAGLKDEGVKRALRAGVLNTGVLRQVRAATGGSKMADKFLKFIGLTRLDAVNRIFAANAGEIYAEKQFARLLKRNEGGKMGDWMRTVSNPEFLRLQELGIDVKEAIKRGALNEEDRQLAAYGLSRESQFLSRNIDLPYFASSAHGKLFMQFRTFAFQQGAFLKRQLIDDLAGKGDFKRGVKNLATFALVFPIAGEVLGDIRSLVSGSKRPTKLFARYIDDIAMAGGMGLALEAMKSANNNRLAEFLLGAGISDAIGFAQNTVNAIKGNPEPLIKQGINTIPFGRGVSNRIFPSTAKGETVFKELQDLLNGD